MKLQIPLNFLGDEEALSIDVGGLRLRIYEPIDDVGEGIQYRQFTLTYDGRIPIAGPIAGTPGKFMVEPSDQELYKGKLIILPKEKEGMVIPQDSPPAASDSAEQ